MTNATAARLGALGPGPKLFVSVQVEVAWGRLVPGGTDVGMLDLSAIPLPPGSILPLFAHLGLVDSALGPKPALAIWDSVLAVPLAH